MLCELLAGQGGQEVAAPSRPIRRRPEVRPGYNGVASRSTTPPPAPAALRTAPRQVRPQTRPVRNGRKSHLSSETTHLVRSPGSFALPRTSVALLHESDASGNQRVGAEGAAGRRASSPATQQVEHQTGRPRVVLDLDATRCRDATNRSRPPEYSAAGSTHGHHRDVDIDLRDASWRRPTALFRGQASRPAHHGVRRRRGAEATDPSLGTNLRLPALHLSSRRDNADRIEPTTRQKATQDEGAYAHGNEALTDRPPAPATGRRARTKPHPGRRDPRSRLPRAASRRWSSVLPMSSWRSWPARRCSMRCAAVTGTR